MRRVAWTVFGLSLALAMGCPPEETVPAPDAGSDQSGDAAGDGGDGSDDKQDLCAGVRCKGGSHCEVTEVQCITEPCPPIVECVPDADETGPGCELIDCLPEYTCVEDASGVGSCVPVGGGVSCGKNTCSEGEVCCNASCGICTPPDGACIQLACEENACDRTVCELGTHCELVEVQCLVPPCDPVAECVVDEECTGPIIDCAAPPPGCNYEGGGCVKGNWTCGTLVCDVCADVVCDRGQHCEDACLVPQPGNLRPLPLPCESAPMCVDDKECTGPLPPCAAPPEGCNYEGFGCVNGNWTCGTLVCGDACGDIFCQQGQHCEDPCATFATKPGLVAPVCLVPPTCVNDDPCAALDCASCKVVDGKAQCGTPCGDNTCLDGQECCNASCGTCVKPGGSCIQLVCE